MDNIVPHTIQVYQTHIEVHPYKLEDAPTIEKMYSKWDEVRHEYINVGYLVHNDTLYLPRGTSQLQLTKLFKASPVVMRADSSSALSKPITMLYSPRNKIQEKGIEFLTSSDQFKKGVYYTQYGLNLDTGDGKTFCMISAISALNMKAIIITHKTRIKNQWFLEFTSKSDISTDSIVKIDGSSDIRKIMDDVLYGDIYIVNHQTLASYAKEQSWDDVYKFFKKIRVGIKVIDEAHKFFRNTLLIDFFSNVRRSYYLTATFTRNDPKEVRIYKKAFSSCYRFGEETLNYDERRKHIIFIPVFYRTKPSSTMINSIVCGLRGFNSYRFIDYALKADPDHTMIKILKKIIHKIEGLDGRVLITSPKIESINIIADAISEETDKSIGCVYSKQSPEKNAAEIQKDIISSTIKGIGEGDNIKNIRVIINTEPIGSIGLADQLRGRLREYSPTDDTYMFYLVDLGIQYTANMYSRIESVMRKKCKEIIQLKIDHI